MGGIAVIIVSYNSSSLIQKVLGALENQTRKPERILVIDSGSADVDATAAIVALHTQVEWFPQTNNIGFAAANNIGISMCPEAEYIALLNPDAFPAPSWLAKLVSATETYPESASFASRLLNYADPNILDGAGDLMAFHGKPRRRGHGSEAGGAFVKPEQVFCPCAAAALYRRHALIEAGGFDEDYFCYLEDVDLGFRLRLLGYQAIYVPDAIVHHVGSATTGGQHSDFSVYHGHRNLIWTFIKDMPGILFWLLLPFHLLLNLVALAHFTLRRQGKIILQAKIDAISGIPKMWKKRKAIQARHNGNVSEILRALDLY